MSRDCDGSRMHFWRRPKKLAAEHAHREAPPNGRATYAGAVCGHQQLAFEVPLVAGLRIAEHYRRSVVMERGRHSRSPLKSADPTESELNPPVDGASSLNAFLRRVRCERADHFCFLWHYHSHVLRRSRAPHFHAEYHGQEALVDFSGSIIEGEIASGTARKLIKEWARAHRFELEANWRRAKKLQPLENIAPLE